MWYSVMHVEPGSSPRVQPGLVGIAVVVVPRRAVGDDRLPFLALIADMQAANRGATASAALADVARATAGMVAGESGGAFRVEQCRWIVVDPAGYFDEALFGRGGEIDWQPLAGHPPRSLHALLEIEGGREAWLALLRIPDVGDLPAAIEAQSEVRRIGELD